MGKLRKWRCEIETGNGIIMQEQVAACAFNKDVIKQTKGTYRIKNYYSHYVILEISKYTNLNYIGGGKQDAYTFRLLPRPCPNFLVLSLVSSLHIIATIFPGPLTLNRKLISIHISLPFLIITQPTCSK